MAHQESGKNPEFPVEIHRMILDQYTDEPNDLTHLWTACRRVSARFRYIVDNIFESRILPSTELCFHRHLLDTKVVCHDTGFGFLHLSSDGKKAIYGHGPPTGDDLLHKLADENGLRMMLEWPFHTIRIGWGVNDVHLPNPSVDTNLGTVTFDWKELFSIFFAEEKLFHEILERTPCHSPRPRFDHVLENTIVTSQYRKLPTVPQYQPLLNRLLQQHVHDHPPCLPHLKPLSRVGLAKQAARRVRLAHFTSLLLGRSPIIDEAYRTQEAHVMSDLYDCQLRIEDGDFDWEWEGEGDERYFCQVDERFERRGGCQEIIRNYELDTGREGAWFGDLFE